MLVRLGVRWLVPFDLVYASVLALAGIVLAMAIYRIGFSRFADNNIIRIGDIPGDKACIFAFQSWTSYPLVVFMISLGVFLRRFSPIPKPFLAVVYIGIGGSLFLASFHYHLKSVRLIDQRGVRK